MPNIITNPIASRFILLAIAIASALLAGTGSGKPVAAQQLPKNLKPEDIVERAILAYGSRVAIYTIQKNGILRGQIKYISSEGNSEGRFVIKFIRKPKLADDLMMLEVDLTSTKFVLGFDGKQTWSLNNGVVADPSPETVAAFRNAHSHGFEAILRYKENDGKLAYIGSKTFGPNNELDIVDLTLPDGVKTRYEISRRSGRIIYLEYDDKGAEENSAVKYRLYFKDFRAIQNVLVPYEVQVFRDGKTIEERKLVESAFSVQLDESAFQVENARKPAEPSAKP